MNSTPKPLLPPGTILFLSGAFFAAEAAGLLYSSAGKNSDHGLFLALCAAEMFCGFAAAAAGRRSSGTLVAAAGALLLTLRAGISTHPAAAICSFLAAGGTAAYLCRNRRTNTFLPFVCAFVCMLTAAVFFPAYCFTAAACLGILLTGALVVNAVKLKHLRWLFLLLLPLQGVFFMTEQTGLRQIRIYHSLHLTAASALPAALLSPDEEGRISILQATSRPEFADAVPWKHISFVKKPVLLDLSSREPVGRRLEKIKTDFDLVSLELLPSWHPLALEQLFLRLYEMTDEENGVMVFPREMLVFVPPSLKAVPVPGTDNMRFAVGRKVPETDPEKLDSRLQRHLAAAGDREFMLPGVFTGLYKKDQIPPEKISDFRRHSGRTHGLFFWISAGLLWLVFRLVFSRKGGSSAFFAAADNYCSAALIVLTAFSLTAFSRIDSFLPEWCYVWCIVPALPFFGKKGNTERTLLLCSLILPWLFLSGGGGYGHFIFVFAVALAVSFSCGVTGAKLLFEKNASPFVLTTGAFCGAALAGLLFSLFFTPENIVPVLAVSAVLRLGCLLRK